MTYRKKNIYTKETRITIKTEKNKNQFIPKISHLIKLICDFILLVVCRIYSDLVIDHSIYPVYSHRYMRSQR